MYAPLHRRGPSTPLFGVPAPATPISAPALAPSSSSSWTKTPDTTGQQLPSLSSVCEQRFGYASASDWADKDISAWQENLGGLPRRDIATTSQPPAKAKANANAGQSSKRQQLSMPTPTHLQVLHMPPLHPNTTLARDAFDPSSSLAHVGSMQAQLLAWERLLQDYPDDCFRDQMVSMI
ncbi:hypothetical protein [Sporisorium scitamineum]|uniref:Uncharacterized protein n=1 Tax=Sporisorium scitamineum TaxID=49012 RepID=A0A0F7RYD3_9BASI|nr:hypothetical protein [Sporisorium scitamineum]